MAINAPVRTRETDEAASGASVYVRVPATPKASGGWIGLQYIPDTGTGTEAKREDPYIAYRFPDLADWWHNDTDALSLDEDKFDHVAYQRIISLGPEAIRYILADLRDRQGHWFDALRELTHDDTVDANANGSMRRAREAWLNWGKAHDLL